MEGRGEEGGKGKVKKLIINERRERTKREEDGGGIGERKENRGEGATEEGKWGKRRM